MKTIVKNNNSYTAIRLVAEKQQKKLYWMWGKIDFVSLYGEENGVWRCHKVSLLKDNKFYDFVEITSHGTMFEETKWVNQKETLYIELPRHFSHFMVEISNSLLL